MCHSACSVGNLIEITSSLDRLSCAAPLGRQVHLRICNDKDGTSVAAYSPSSKVDRLMEMGFTKRDVLCALQECQGDLDNASSLLTEQAFGATSLVHEEDSSSALHRIFEMVRERRYDEAIQEAEQKRLLEKEDPEFGTLMSFAVDSRNYELVKKLLQKGAEVNESHLKAAMEHSNEEDVKEGVLCVYLVASKLARPHLDDQISWIKHSARLLIDSGQKMSKLRESLKRCKRQLSKLKVQYGYKPDNYYDDDDDNDDDDDDGNLVSDVEDEIESGSVEIATKGKKRRVENRRMKE